MDSLAYSVMLEMKTNTSSLNKDLQKSLTIANDYHKQMSKNFDSSTKAVKGYINAHSGLNKVYKEELSWWDKIGRASGSVLKTMLLLPVQITKSIAGIAVGVIRSITSAITGAISYVSKYIDQVMGQYDKMIEEYRFANVQAAGGVSLLYDRMTDLMEVSGATSDEAKKIVGALINAGFSAKEMGNKFGILSNTMWEFERITGVSSETSAGLMKSLGGVGFNAESTRKMFVGLARQMYASRLTTSEMTEVMNNLREEMYSLEFAFDKEAVVKYSEALGDLAGAAKLVGVNVSKATALMSELNRNPMKFVVALGSDAFYKSAGENLETLIANLNQMRATLDGVPPGLKPELLQSIYGIDTATFKMLEGMEEFRKKYPAIAQFGKMLETANSSLGRMYEIIHSKVMAAFNKLAARFNEIRIDFFGVLTKDIPERIQRLIEALFGLVNKVFDMGALNDWRGGLEKINEYFGKLIDKATIWVRVFSDGETVQKIANYSREIYKIFSEKLVPAAINFAKALIKWIWEAVVFVGGLLGKLFKYVDGWIENGGPKKLGEALTWIGEKIQWIFENPLTSMGIYLTVTMLPAAISLAAQFASLAPALKKGLVMAGRLTAVTAAAAVGWAFGKAIASSIPGTIQEAKAETDKLNESIKKTNELLEKQEKFEKSLVGLVREQALAEVDAEISKNRRILAEAENRGAIFNWWNKEEIKLARQRQDLLLEQKKGYEALAPGSTVPGASTPDGALAPGSTVPGASTPDGAARPEKDLADSAKTLTDAMAEAGEASKKIYETLNAGRIKQEDQLGQITSNTEKTANELNELNNELNKKREAIGTGPRSEMGRELSSIGEKYISPDGKEHTITFGDVIASQLNQERQRTLMGGGIWDEAAQESARKELLNKTVEDSQLLFFKAFKSIKDSGTAKDKKWTDADVLRETKKLTSLSQEGLGRSELFKSLGGEQQYSIREAQHRFESLENVGELINGKYLEIEAWERSVGEHNPYIQEIKDVDKQIKDLKMVEDAARQTTAQTVEPQTPQEPVKSDGIPKGSKGGAKAEQVMTSAPAPAQTPIKLDKESLKDLGEVVAVGEKQVGLLSSIEKKIGNNLYNRNNPSHDEVTSTIWGN